MKIVPRPRVLSLGARPSRRSLLSKGLERLEERRLLAISSVLVPYPGSVTMTGDASADTLLIDRNGQDLQHNTLTAPAGQSYADNLDFDSTVAGSQTVTDGTYPVTINGGGNDSITLGDASTPASTFATSFTVNGLPGGNDSLTIDDSADTTYYQTITIDNNSVAFSSGPTITYSGLATLTVIASGQTVNVLSTPAGTSVTVENSGSSPDEVTVGNAGLVNGVAGPVSLVSQGAGETFDLTVNDVADPNPVSPTLTATSLTGLAPAAIDFGSAQLNSLTIAGSNGANNVTVSGTPAGIQTEIITGAGNSMFNVAAAGLGTGSTLDLMGGSGANTLTEDAGLGTLTALTPPNAAGEIPATIVISNGPTLEYANLQAISINNLADQALTAAPPVTINASQGQTLTNVTVGSFTDADPNGAAADYSATINWGDGTPVTVGTVIANGTGGFEVQGSHTYATSGTFPVSVSVLDNGSTGTESVGGVPVTLSDNGGASTSIASTANVSPSVLSGTGQPINTVEGNPFSGSLGTFTSSDPSAPVSDYSATIDWGDPSPDLTVGTIVNEPGVFTVSGTHTYAEETPVGAPDTFSVLITEVGGGNTTFSASATVADAPLTADIKQPGQVNATEGISTGLVPLFTFDDGNTAATGADYTATIDWGDGSPLETVLGTSFTAGLPGVFTVNGTHTYAQEGSDPITVTVNDVGGSSVIGHNTASVADAPLYPAVQPTVAVTEGMTFTLPVGAFVDLNPTAPLSDYSARINWGDGTSSAGFVTPFSPSGSGSNVITLPNKELASLWLVSGTHSYAAPGVEGLTITVGDIGGSTTTIDNNATVGLDNVVTNTNDSGRGSLRFVMQNVAAYDPGGTVVFDIPGTGPFVIHPMTPLPTITVPMVIDATTEPGYAGKPIVAISGDQIPNDDGLTLAAGATTVKGLAIDNFNGSVGVVLQGPGGDVVENDWVGIDSNGADAPNFQGVLIQGSSNNTILDNVISGNHSVGIQVFDSQTIDPALTPAGPASGNVIEGNIIGVSANGASSLPNQQGVFLNDAANNSVLNNVIATNRSIGVQILGENATGNLIQGNVIGGNRTGIFIYAGANTVGTNDFGTNSVANEQVRTLASGPVVESAVPTPVGGSTITGVNLTFTTYLNPTTAMNLNNYVVNRVGNHLAPGARIPVASVAYDNVNRTVTLTLGKSIPAGALFEVRVVGQSPNGITDRSGNFLDGANILPAPQGGSDAFLYFQNGVQVNPIPTFPSKSSGKVIQTAAHAEAVDAVLGALPPASRAVRSRR